MSDYFQYVDRKIEEKSASYYTRSGISSEKASLELKMLNQHGIVPWMQWGGYVYFAKRETLEKKSIPTVIIRSRGPMHKVFFMSHGNHSEVIIKNKLNTHVTFKSDVRNEEYCLIFRGTRWGKTKSLTLSNALETYMALETILEEMRESEEQVA